MSLICLVTAMTAEAKPFIQAFDLKPLPQRGQSAWVGDTVCLVQTGMGHQRAEARIDALLSVQNGINGFINVGIAGGDRELGDVIIASCVRNQDSGRAWYPQLPPSSVTGNAEHCEVVTVPEPSNNYKSGCVYDMEAAAVTKVASQHTDLSRIQTVKVISDNPSHPLDDFSVKNVSPWMRNALPTVTALIDWMKTDAATRDALNFRQQVDSLVLHITGVCHHSVTQHHQLRRYLERFLALHGELPTLEHLGQLDNSHEVLQRLEAELVKYPVNY